MNNQKLNQGVKEHSGSDNTVDMDALLVNLKKEDARATRQIKNFKWVFYIMIVFYTLSMIVNPDPNLKWHQRTTGLCYAIAFVIFAFLFRKYHKEFLSIDYFLSISEMFKKAAERYNFKIIRFLYVLPSLLLIDVGLTMSEFYRLLTIDPFDRILIVQAFYIPIILISAFVGYLFWGKRQKPLRDGALQILRDLDEP
jgi:hypothetical protein